MRILLFLLLLSPVFASAQILRAYGVIEVGSLPTSSATGPKFAYRPADSSFYRWVSGSTWVKIIPDEPDTLYLKQLSGTTALVDGDTIDISTYFLKSDTTSAFASYLKRPVGWGLSLLTGKYPFVDSSKVASRYYVSTSPTAIANNYLATSNGSNLVARNLFDNNTYVGILNSKPFQLGQWTTAGRPTGIAGYSGWNTTLVGEESYDGTRWNSTPKAVKSTFTSTYVPYINPAGQFDETSNLLLRNTNQLKVGAFNLGSHTSPGIFTSGIVRASGGFSLRDPSSGDEIFTGMALVGGVVEMRVGNATVVQFRAGGGGSDHSVVINRGANPGGSVSSTDFTAGFRVAGNHYHNPPFLYTGTISGFSDVSQLGNTGNNPQVLKYNNITLTPNYRNAGQKIGILYNPNVGAEMAGSIHYALHIVSGDVLLNTKSGNTGIGLTLPTENLDINDDLRIRDSARLGATPLHSSITGLLTRDANGWVGIARVGSGLIYAGDSLTVKNIAVGNDSTYGLKSFCADINIQGQYIYAASRTLNKILIYDKTNPGDTLRSCGLDVGGARYKPRRIKTDITKNRLYVLCNDDAGATGASRLIVYNISDQLSPIILGSVDVGFGFYPTTFDVNDTLIYVHRINETLVYGISTTGAFNFKGSINNLGAYHNEIKFYGGNLFFAGTNQTKDTAYLQVYSTSSVIPSFVAQYKNKTLLSFNGIDIFGSQVFLVSENNYVASVNFINNTLALDKFSQVTGVNGSSYIYPYSKTKGVVLKTDNTVLVGSSASKYLFEFSLPELNLLRSQEIDSNIISIDVYNNLIHMVFADNTGNTSKIIKGNLQRSIIKPTTVKEQSGIVSFSAYGTPATTAAALSKTLTNYGVGFATDGTVTSREIKRDTTIYIDDADYDFSAAITTAQIASRFNRVIFWMTTTAAAGSDSELTLHTPDANLLQVEYLIHSVDEPAGFDNKIVFGSNNAVDSTNGLVSSYFPAAGQGVGIRAGLRSSVYKYRYY